MSDWLMEEGALDADVALVGLRSTRHRGAAGAVPEGAPAGNIAVFLKPLVVLDTRKWFGEAELRLDALVSHGGSESLYHPRTFRFPRVRDGENLAGSDNGLMVFYGRPEHFLTMSLTLSRDTKDSDDLATLMQEQAGSDGAASLIAQLAAASSPHVAAVQASIEAALSLGNLAYELVRKISPQTLGLYRANWLGTRDAFGLGRHPQAGSLRVKDFELAYDVVVDQR